MKICNTGYSIGVNQYNPAFRGEISVVYKKNASNVKARDKNCSEDYKLYDYAMNSLFNNDLSAKTISIPNDTLKQYTDGIGKLTWFSIFLPSKGLTEVELDYNRDSSETSYTVKTDKFKVTHKFDNDELEAKKILNRGLKFGPEEYKSLSAEDLETLRKYKNKYLCRHGIYVNLATTLGSAYSKRLREQYPDGLTLVCVGRSPALVSKYLEFEGANSGINVKYCPISNLNDQNTYSTIYADFIPIYKKYLDSIGLTKEFAEKTDKPIIITDYCSSGKSLSTFRDMLASPEIGIEESDKVQYRPMTANKLFDNPIFDCDPSDENSLSTEPNFPREIFNKYIIWGQTHHHYASVPRMSILYFYADKNRFDEFYKNGNKFEESFDVKMMNFCIAEYVNEHSREIDE